MPDKDSPFWPILRVTLRSLVLLAGLVMFYDRLDPRDALTLLTCVASDGLITAATRVFGGSSPNT